VLIDTAARPEGLPFTGDSSTLVSRRRHDGSHPVHSHSYVEVVTVVSGRGFHCSSLGRQPITPGDVLVMRPGAWHGYEECEALELVNLCFTAELLHHELAWTREDPLVGYLLWDGPYAPQQFGMLAFRLDPPAFAECARHLDTLTRLNREQLLRYRSDLIGTLALTLGSLARAADDARDQREMLGGHTNPAALQAIRLLESRLAHQWTLAELAEELHLTPNYLVRLFKSTTGLPPMAYLARHRVETAAIRLINSHESVAQIGASVGWPDQNYFARRFKAHFGLSARTYRTRGNRL
jgi:AraC family L-rhamnose operon transcriptional activator RhaR